MQLRLRRVGRLKQWPKEVYVFSRKIPVGNDLYQKMKQCSESAGYATAEEFALHTLEKEVDRVLSATAGKSDEEISNNYLQGLGDIE